MYPPRFALQAGVLFCPNVYNRMDIDGQVLVSCESLLGMDSLITIGGDLGLSVGCETGILVDGLITIGGDLGLSVGGETIVTALGGTTYDVHLHFYSWTKIIQRPYVRFGKSFACRVDPEDYDEDEDEPFRVNWQEVRGAWVAAITVCQRLIESPNVPDEPENIPDEAPPYVEHYRRKQTPPPKLKVINGAVVPAISVRRIPIKKS